MQHHQLNLKINKNQHEDAIAFKVKGAEFLASWWWFWFILYFKDRSALRVLSGLVHLLCWSTLNLLEIKTHLRQCSLETPVWSLTVEWKYHLSSQHCVLLWPRAMENRGGVTSASTVHHGPMPEPSAVIHVSRNRVDRSSCPRSKYQVLRP